MSDMRDGKRLVHRTDADGRLQVGPSWESLIERQLREAMEEGQFDDLPYHGQPLPNDGNPLAGDRELAFHVLRNAGVAPPWIEADKEVRALLMQRDAIMARAATGLAASSFAKGRDREQLHKLVAGINAAIARVNAESPTDAQRRRPLVLADELAKYDEMRDNHG